MPGAMAIPCERLRQVPDNEWDDLKDVLYTHYIQENMTLGGIIQTMREKHNILLT